MFRVRGLGLVFKAHRLVYHAPLGLRVIQKKKKRTCGAGPSTLSACVIFTNAGAVVGSGSLELLLSALPGQHLFVVEENV